MLSPLFRLELRQLLRQPLTWAVLVFLFVAMLAASAAGTARVRAQDSTLGRIAVEQQQSIERVRRTTRAWSSPGDLVVPVFRDPTDAYSYFYNFMMVHAVKPPAPLAAVAAGQSNLQPSHIRLNMNDVFPDAAYELRSPRILALGAFDLAFVLVYLVPLAVIALAGTSLAREQDSGVLRLIAAQPVEPRTVAAAKFGALAALLVPVVATGAFLALLLTDAIGSGVGLAALAALGALIALYIAFWIALCGLVVSFWRGSVQTLAILVLTWATMTVLVPAAGALILDTLFPAPSRLAYIDASRAAADDVPISWEHEAGATRWLASRPDLGPVSADAASSAEAGRLARDVFYRRQLEPMRLGFEEHGQRIDSGTGVLRLLSPASLLDGSLQTLARTDMASQRAFVRAADRHSQTLRRHFEPLIVANIGRDRPCAACPGRLNFAAYDAVPKFTFDSGTGLRHGALAILYLSLLTAIVGLWVARRFRHWPA